MRKPFNRNSRDQNLRAKALLMALRTLPGAPCFAAKVL